jgi:hypothetical protein
LGRTTLIDTVSGTVGWQPQRVGRRADATESDSATSRTGGTDLTNPEVQRQIQQLRTTDQKVRQHEQAHVSAGGPHAGSPSYQFTRGPDNKNYAVAGEVPIDASPERDPEATIRKMETVKRAALAPPDPSPQDLRVAQQADAAAAQARTEQRRQQAAEERGGSDGDRNVAAGRGAAAYGSAAAIGIPTRPNAISISV